MNTDVSKPEEIIEWKPISSLLRGMQVNDFEDFSVSQYDSVKMTANKLQIKNRQTGLKFETKLTGNILRITRVN